MDNIIIIAIIVIIVGFSGLYIYKAKKSGKKCIGCPDSKTCSGNCSCCNSCKQTNDE
ncbi:MAG: FeoB-associated Cys-rich membrane protein [Clostridia bacterium]|nr:FeoB-associated Cys-rich membrane protein [Clostridia bacterium]